MPSSSAQQNIWKQMNYTPPRGPCNHKESLLSPKCPCLRFMLHPLKVTSSFTCDGCNHHASFHSMASPADDATIARWASETPTTTTTTDAPRSRKRPRRALLEAAPSTTNASAAAAAATDLDVDTLPMLFSDDVEFAGSQPGGKTWGDRFSSWSFGGRAGEEPVKTPPKRQQGGAGGQRRRRGGRRREEDAEAGSDFAEMD
ncbi:hypothetical protein SLS57_000320 [Botryosphaeria dothidea]